ncbi:hypothetical protein [Nonomuraea soli]|uniref:Thioesterase family protein n=1 Tax=Nonomuraea soli TaxID=1032476 RepID=A0A7W0CFC4_9ACTN|nr:hypothetical protein [Nonomuraea soli]MBA2890157.1 hypothetical protein [Nonomuraea soli]
MLNQNIVIDPAFEGPPASAHGGYACGLLAPYLPPDAEITLRKPVRLGVTLRLKRGDGGLRLHDGFAVVAEAGTTTLVNRAPRPPTVAEASSAAEAFPGRASSAFARCVVCGTGRTDADAFRVFPGPLPGRDLMAAVWRPNGSALAGDTIKPEYVWAALDCPAGWAAMWFGPRSGVAVLGRMAAWVPGPIAAYDTHILVGWLEGGSGRKLHAGSALYSPSGTLQAFSCQTWITLTKEPR